MGCTRYRSPETSQTSARAARCNANDTLVRLAGTSSRTTSAPILTCRVVVPNVGRVCVLGRVAQIAGSVLLLATGYGLSGIPVGIVADVAAAVAVVVVVI